MFSKTEKEDKLSAAIFLGALSLDKNMSGLAYSEAGMQVQLEIIRLLHEKLDDKLDVISMNPMPIFPNGKFINKYCRNNIGLFPPFINLPILKHLFYSIFVFILLFKFSPKKIFVYNSYFFQNIFLFIYKKIFPNVEIVVLVQDVLSVGKGFQAIQRFLDRNSLYWLSFIDLLVPISVDIACDFNISAPSLLVQGGLTKKIMDDFPLNNFRREKEHRAVFAGSLEPHNGIHILIDHWIRQDIKMELHIFGKGSLRDYVIQSAENYPQIHYHGFAPHSDVQLFIAKSQFIVILRFDLGIESKYFFPSKFWEAVASDSCIICNRFNGFPVDLSEYCFIAADDFSNLKEIEQLYCSDEIVLKRKQYIFNKYTWDQHVDRIISKLCG